MSYSSALLEPERQIVLPNWETFIVYLAEMMMMRRMMTMMMMMRRKMLAMLVMTMMMMLMMTILVWCEREVNSGDVEVDVGQAGDMC